MESKHKPDYIVKSVRKIGEEADTGKDKNRWTDIGVAFYNQKSDTFSISLNALPITDRIVLVRPLPPQDVPKQMVKAGPYRPFSRMG
jgi:hypothetical protein